ncbi:MAG TPA: helix-turn-helix domain-containing protein [Pedobacter sp.]|jgi:AraC-like DNA-binding protein
MNVPSTAVSDLLSILSLGASLLLAFLCLMNTQKVNKSGNRWLGVFVSCIFFLYIDENLALAGFKIEHATKSLIILNFTAFIFAPAFFYTVSYFIRPDRSWKIKDYFHLLTLGIIYLLLSTYLLFVEPLHAKEGPNFLLTLIASNFGVLYSLQIFYYCGASWVKLKKHENDVRLFTASIENIDLRWLKGVVICVIVMSLLFIINISINLSYYYIFELFYLVGIFIIASFSLKQKEIYPFTNAQTNEILHDLIQPSNSAKLESKKLIEDSKIEELKAILLHIMESRKPFLDCELTLVKLAAMMDISLHQLSYLINTGFDENFYQFVNRYRIEETKKMLLDVKSNHLSFQGIATEVGFKSKSVFNATFKRYTGQTPREYKAQNNNTL